MAQTAWTADKIQKIQPCIECENLEQRNKVVDRLKFMGFKYENNFGEIVDTDLYVETFHSCEFGVFDIPNDTFPVILASELLNTPPPNPELQALKKRLIEIADSGYNEDTNEFQYFDALHNYMKTTGLTCTALANLIINSDL